MGSWAGAMGQNQFMPSSFLRYAVDHDGDGRRDIWGTTADIFASSANYLSKVGWRGDQTWGRMVRLPDRFRSRPGRAQDPKGVARLAEARRSQARRKRSPDPQPAVLDPAAGRRVGACLCGVRQFPRDPAVEPVEFLCRRGRHPFRPDRQPLGQGTDDAPAYREPAAHVIRSPSLSERSWQRPPAAPGAARPYRRCRPKWGPTRSVTPIPSTALSTARRSTRVTTGPASPHGTDPSFTASAPRTARSST